MQSGLRWSRFYAVSIGFAATNSISLLLTFWTDKTERRGNVLHTAGAPIEIETATIINAYNESGLDQEQTALEQIADNSNPYAVRSVPSTEEIGRGAKDTAIVRNRTVWFICFFLLLYTVSL